MGDTIKGDEARARILKSAGELFYAEGVNTVGVDRISALAPVSKRTLYQRFPTKDDLITEYLRTTGEITYESLFSTSPESAPPLERILDVFRALEEQSSTAEYRGCRFLNVVAELPDASHPARKVALDYKNRMVDFFAEQAARAGAADPRDLGEHLLMLLDGAAWFSVVQQKPISPSVRSAAKALVEAQTAAA